MIIGIVKDSYQPKGQKFQHKSAAAGQGAVALLCSTYFIDFQTVSTKESKKLRRDISIWKWIVPFFLQHGSVFLNYRGRSPPSGLKFQPKNFRLEEKPWRVNIQKEDGINTIPTIYVNWRDVTIYPFRMDKVCCTSLR